MAKMTPADALTQLQDVMRRPHRRGSDHGFAHFLLLMTVAAIPLWFLLFVLIALGLPPASPSDAQPPPVALTEAAELAESILRDPPVAEADDVVAFTERFAALRDLAALTATSSDTPKEQQLWSRQVVFFSALTVTILFGTSVVFAQLSIIGRHWDHLLDFKNHEDATRNAPFVRVALAACLFLLPAMGLVSSLPETLVSAGMGRFPLLHQGLSVLLVTLTLTVLFVTAHGVFMYVLNYPRVTEIDEIELALSDAAGDGTSIADVALQAYASNAWRPTGKARVHQTFGPTETALVIDSMVRVAAVFVVVALGTIWLGLQVLATDAALSGDDAAALKRVHEGWVVAIGVGFSLSLAVIYVWSMSRLGPYAGAAAGASGDASKGWVIKGRSPVALTEPEMLDLTVERPKGVPVTEFPDDMIDALGANRQKFTVMMDATRYGAGFHSVLQGDAVKRLGQVLTLVAPAAVGTVLGLFG